MVWMVDLHLLPFAGPCLRDRNVVVKPQPSLLVFFILRLNCEGFETCLIIAEMILKHCNGVRNSE